MGWVLFPVKIVLRLACGKAWKEVTWNWMILKLLNFAPRIWGGKYGAYQHGRKSRDWLYRIWTESKAKADKTDCNLDDNAIEWVKGFQLFDVEVGAYVGRLEQALNDLTHGCESVGQMRVREVMVGLRDGSKS